MKDEHWNPRTLQTFGEWLNDWGNLDQHPNRTNAWRDGYEEALRDVNRAFNNMVPDWPERDEAVLR